MEMPILQNWRRNAHLRHEDSVEGMEKLIPQNSDTKDSVEGTVSGNSFSFPLMSLSDKRDIQDGKRNNMMNDVEQLKLAAIYDDKQTIIDIFRPIITSDEEIQRLLSNQDERGQPCLFYALESRSLNCLSYLLDYVKDKKCIIAYNGESVLHVATRMGDEEILRMLLKNKLIAGFVNHVKSDNGRSPLHFAAKFNHLDIAKVLLEHDGKITEDDITERSPLYIAAYEGHAKILDLFLKQGKCNVNDLRKVLHNAVNSGDESTVKVFLEHDDDIGRTCLQEEISDSYLIHDICKNGMENILSQLVSKTEDIVALQMKRKDEQGFTPLHQAVMNNHSSLVRYIGSMDTDFVNEKTENSQSALVLAVQRGYQQVVEELLDLNADFNIRDGSNGNKTVLHYAIAYPEILKILLKKNDRILSLINAKREDGGYTPIHDAAYHGLVESVRILLEHGANLNVFSMRYRTPLYCAVLSQNSDVVELILVHEPALINKVDDTKETPLHTAAKENSSEVVKCLLNDGAIMLTDKDKSTPLHIAAQHGHLDIVKLLVENKPSMIDRENVKKRTALLEAASHGKIDVVKYLLDNNAAITKDDELFGCLDYAILNGNKDNAIAMVCHNRWDKMIEKTMYGRQGTMAILISKKMSEVAYQVLCKSMTSTNNPESDDYKVKYDFKCLKNNTSETSKGTKKFKPLTAIETMLLFKSYKCLRHPVCCKFLKEKWKELGWKVSTVSFIVYVAFLTLLNVYATNIPSYNPSVKSTELPEANINVKAVMVICLVLTGIEILNEIIQIVVDVEIQALKNYLLDPVNYLEWILYTTTIIFAVPSHENIAAKTSLQWKACSLALFCAWINLAMYLRRFASYGIIFQMMWEIFVTTMKVMLVFICFMVAFAAAFTSIMNDREVFKNFGYSLLTGAMMTLGELNFQDTFLGDRGHFNTFFPLQLCLVCLFIIIMPIIAMNLLIALAIGDTSRIMQDAKLQKHIQTAKMIIDIERKKYIPWIKTCFKQRKTFVDHVEEKPNKKHGLSDKFWEIIFYGPDFSTDSDDEVFENIVKNDNMSKWIEIVEKLQRENCKPDCKESQETLQKNKENEPTEESKRRYIEMKSDDLKPK